MRSHETFRSRCTRFCSLPDSEIPNQKHSLTHIDSRETNSHDSILPTVWMESKKLAALLSSLISQLLLLLLPLFPSSNSISLSPNSADSDSNSDANSYANLFPLINYFLSFQEIATSLSLFPNSRKRKRTHL